MSSDSHDKMIEVFQEYFKWQTNFEYKGSDEAGIKARNCLSEIRKLAFERRKEIQEARDQRKAARKGMVGRPKKVSKSDDSVDTPRKNS